MLQEICLCRKTQLINGLTKVIDNSGLLLMLKLNFYKNSSSKLHINFKNKII